MKRDAVRNPYPVEAFALPFILFTTAVRQSILAGILTVWLLLFSLLLKNLLKPPLPEWSRRMSVLTASAAVSFSLFRVTGDAHQGDGQTLSYGLAAVFIGILTARAVWDSGLCRQYGRLTAQGAFLWLMMVFTGVFREFLSQGSILGIRLAAFPWQSAAFARPAAGLIFTASVFALLDTGKPERKHTGLAGIPVPVFALLILSPPAQEQGSILSSLAGAAAVLAACCSGHLSLACTEKPFGPLPTVLMAAGFFYMIAPALFSML